MKKITARAFSVLLIALLVVVGMGRYIMRYIDEGEKWALYFSRANSGSSGVLTDRNGTMLAAFDSTNYLYSSDSFIRRSNYHVTGDYWGRTGTGLITRYWKELHDFSLLTGTTRAESSILQLNIDAGLNCAIYRALGEESSGCMLVCNYKTGELLGMVSTPTTDPMDAESEVRDGTYINRCLSAAFTPGSIFKLITAAAAYENIPDLSQKMFWCEGEYEIAGVPITCIGEHYNQTFEQALSNSCNVAFAQIAVMLGQNTMIDYVTKYGFLDSQSLSGIDTVKGVYPLEFVGDPELGWSGVGQSTDLVCPYTMLRFLCAVANEGMLIEPEIVRSLDEAEPVRFMNADTARKLAEMMNYTVVEHYGEDAFPGLKLCAKTGTAELSGGAPHSWFVGFLADEEHPYAFVTLVERGGFGISAAGGVTNEVLQWAVKNMN